MKKLLSVILAVMMVMTSLPTFATNAVGGGAGPVIPEGATLIFAEDFESGYAIDTNLLEADGVAEFTKNDKKAITISQPAGDTVPAGYVAKVMPVDGFDGNVLYLENSNAPAYASGTANNNATDNNLKFELFFDGGNAIDTQSPDSPYYGKQLVYEFDAKVEKLRERQFMKLDSSAPGGDGGVLTPFQKASSASWSVRQGPWKNYDGKVRPYMVGVSATMGGKTSFKVVFNQNGDLDSVRTYANGKLTAFDGTALTGDVQGQYYAGKIVKDFVGEYFTNQTVGNMSAAKSLLTYVCPNGTTAAKVYIDNILVYAVDSIDFDGFETATEVNPDEGLVVKFTQPFNATEDTFKVTTAAGADLADAIKSVTMSADKMSANVKMDFGVLDALTSYKLWVDDEFTSEAGATFYADPHGITAENEWVELGAFETCDKLEATSIVPASGTISNYEVGDAQTVVFTFSSALANAVDVENAFVVVDEEGNEIEGLTASISEDRKVITLDLSTLALGEGVHTIKSVDNAIYNNSNIKAAINYTFDTVDFAAAVDPASIPQYVAGTTENNKIAIALSAATTLTNEDVITAFDVVDASGDFVSGLAAYLETDGKFITLDIQDMNLVPGKYTIKSNENLVDKRGRQIQNPIVVSFKVVTEISNAELIFEEDFENDYTVGANWLANGNANETIAAPNGGKWVIAGGNNDAKNFMGVVTKDEVKDKNGNVVNYFDSNVLKIHAATETGFNFWRRPEANLDLAAQGKMLVYEYDVYVPNAFKERKFMAIDTTTYNGFQRLASTNFYISTGPYYQAGSASYGNPENGNWYARSTASLVRKHNVKVIVDQTKAVDSMRTYVDGEVKSAAYNSTDDTYSNYGKRAYDFYGEAYKGAATLDYGVFEGIYTAIGASGGSTVYIDNFKAYAVNAIKFDGVEWGTNSSAEFAPDKGFTIKFSEKISETELKDYLSVKDANGQEIAGAVRSIELSTDGKSAFVKFDFSKLNKLTNYDVFLGFLFRSKDGAYIARDGVVDGGDVHIANFTTSDKLEIAVDAPAIAGYDKGMDKTVTLTLSSALKDGVNPADVFVVKDEAGNEIEGLAATISEDRKVITLQLSGLQLGNGVHTIESIQDALVNNSNIAGSVYITVQTVDFVAVATPASETIKNYAQGTDKKVLILLTTAATTEAGDISNYFEVKDADGNAVAGLKAELAADKKNLTIDLSGLQLGIGQHTIKAKDGILDSRGRNLEFEYKFDIVPFISNYESEISEYVPGSSKVVEIGLTYPLNAASVANIANAFVVKNQYGSNVSGLTVTVSEDAKKILLDLSTLDITGGTYVIASKANAFVNIKGEILADVVIDLSTSAAASDEEITVDTGVGPNAGTDMSGEFTSSVLLSENFDNEGYVRDMNWLTSDAFVPARFSLNVLGDGDDFVDASVSIVEDPMNPGNYVLKNVSGFKDATGTTIAGKDNFHRVKRELDGGKTSIPVDDYTIVKLSTKVMIPSGGNAGIPTGDSGSVGDTKDMNYIIALTNDGTVSLNHANLRQSSGTTQYNSWLNANDTATGSSGSASTALSSDTWHTVELVFGYNPKSNGSKFKSYSVYVDGYKITTSGGYYAYNGSDYSTIGGMMSQIVSASGSSGSTTVYYDDWSVVKMNKLLTHVNVPKADVAENQNIKLQLTNKLTDDSVALIENKGLISVKNEEGKDVDATIAIDNTGANTKIAITPKYGLEYQSTYTVEIAKEYVDDKGVVTTIADEFGNTFGGFAYTFETAKALGNTIDMEAGRLVYDADFMHNEDTFNYTMKLDEAVGTTPVIGAVATFSEDNKLLGIDYQVFNAGEDTKAFTVSSELGAKTIKLFIWEQNSDGTMGRLMQIPDEVTSR